MWKKIMNSSWKENKQENRNKINQHKKTDNFTILSIHNIYILLMNKDSLEKK